MSLYVLKIYMMIWYYASNTYAFYYGNVCDVLHMMCIMNALNDKCFDIMIDNFVLCMRFSKLCMMILAIYRLSIFIMMKCYVFGFKKD